MTLPLVCAKCGGISGVAARPRTFRLPSPEALLLYLGLILLFIFYKGWPLSELGPVAKGLIFAAIFLAQITTGKRSIFPVPLCAPCHRRWDWAQWISVARYAIFVVGIALPRDVKVGQFYLVWLAVLLFVPSIARRWRLSVTLVPRDDKKGMDTSRLWLTDVNETARTAYLDALPGQVKG